jgi:hypothetical protein
LRRFYKVGSDLFEVVLFCLRDNVKWYPWDHSLQFHGRARLRDAAPELRQLGAPGIRATPRRKWPEEKPLDRWWPVGHFFGVSLGWIALTEKSLPRRPRISAGDGRGHPGAGHARQQGGCVDTKEDAAGGSTRRYTGNLPANGLLLDRGTGLRCLERLDHLVQRIPAALGAQRDRLVARNTPANLE